MNRRDVFSAGAAVIAATLVPLRGRMTREVPPEPTYYWRGALCFHDRDVYPIEVPIEIRNGAAYVPGGTLVFGPVAVPFEFTHGVIFVPTAMGEHRVHLRMGGYRLREGDTLTLKWDGPVVTVA